MNGWIDWLVLTVAMVAVGIGMLVFFVNPLLALLLAGIGGLAFWVAPGPSARRNNDTHRS